MNYLEITPCDIANGQGVRTVLWISGCSLNCSGCHTPWTHDRYAGAPFDEGAKQQLFDALSKPYVQGLTLTGGHPLETYNLQDVCKLIWEVKTKFPDKDIWLYTGLTLSWEDVERMHNFCEKGMKPIEHKWHNLKYEIIRNCDVVVDGPFIQEQRDVTLAFRGSRNQRIIDVNKTIEKGEITLWENN